MLQGFVNVLRADGPYELLTERIPWPMQPFYADRSDNARYFCFSENDLRLVQSSKYYEAFDASYGERPQNLFCKLYYV